MRLNSRTRPQAEIEIGCSEGSRNDLVVFVRDSGVGFDMKYVNELFWRALMRRVPML
jgi:light-regulated signal transduction histidine kinase (bacteriophytochrome)